jgi:hypothetical protein
MHIDFLWAGSRIYLDKLPIPVVPAWLGQNAVQWHFVDKLPIKICSLAFLKVIQTPKCPSSYMLETYVDMYPSTPHPYFPNLDLAWNISNWQTLNAGSRCGVKCCHDNRILLIFVSLFCTKPQRLVLSRRGYTWIDGDFWNACNFKDILQ